MRSHRIRRTPAGGIQRVHAFADQRVQQVVGVIRMLGAEHGVARRLDGRHGAGIGGIRAHGILLLMRLQAAAP
ncbi:hypothetical protein [Xanthomonas translucens]|uniref:hypothetical protein n=1 Tax=Xanthomonas campestris pv. translucens TaxID=343 RepID=UPI000A6AC4C8